MLHRRRKGGGNNFRVWPTYPLTPNNPLTFSFNVNVKQLKLDHKCEGIAKSILFISILNFAIFSIFDVRNVIIWH